MKIALIAGFAVLGLMPALSCIAASSTISVDSLLKQEGDISHLPVYRNWTTRLDSSYDRTGGNADFDQFLRRDGSTATMADLTGPGAVVRIWSPNPNGQLKIYIDGAKSPIIDTPFAVFLSGKFLPFTAPLVMASTGGFYSYVPIPYRLNCRITVDNSHGLYYQVGSVAYPPGTKVHTFGLPFNPETETAVKSVSDVWTGLDWPSTVGYKPNATLLVPHGQIRQLVSIAGPGVIRNIRLTVPVNDPAELKKIVMRAYFDGHTHPDIESPVVDFFGDGFGTSKSYSSMLTRRTGNVFEARIPMPFHSRARFIIENGSAHTVKVGWSSVVDKSKFSASKEGIFHAQWLQGFVTNGHPHVWLTVHGQKGHFIGIVQTMAGKNGLGFLEGDDQVRVDGQKWQQCAVKTTVIGPWNGTGTEDFFNSGWYFSGGLNALPNNGVTVKENSGRVSAYRWLLNDAPVFQNSIDAQIEHGGQNDASGTYYSSVAYWYSNGENQMSGRMPSASLIALPAPAPPSYVIPNVIEGEALTNSAVVSGGQVSNQDMRGYAGLWSGDQQLWWRGDKVGDVLKLTLVVPKDGTYAVKGWFTKAVDYGQFVVEINGKALSQTLDLYHDGVVPTGEISLGTIDLPKGPATLTFTASGKNQNAQDYLFGLDAVALTQVP